MIDEVRRFLNDLKRLNIKDIALLASIIEVKSLKAGDCLVKSGESNNNYFIVLKGMLRNYAELPDGEEVTMRLACEGMSTGTTSVLSDKLPATETIVAIENSMVASVNRKQLEKLVEERPNIALVYIDHLKEGVAEANEMIRIHTTMTPEERYIYFRDNHPEIIKRVQVRYLSSLIGITPVSLSRIRARLSKSGK